MFKKKKKRSARIKKKSINNNNYKCTDNLKFLWINFKEVVQKKSRADKAKVTKDIKLFWMKHCFQVNLTSCWLLLAVRGPTLN